MLKRNSVPVIVSCWAREAHCSQPRPNWSPCVFVSCWAVVVILETNSFIASPLLRQNHKSANLLYRRHSLRSPTKFAIAIWTRARILTRTNRASGGVHYKMGTSLTRRGNHPLPLLKQRRLEAVARTQRVRLVSRHQLLHGF